MRHLKSALTVLGAVTVLVLAANTVAMAATGRNFILGKPNSANSVTTLSRTTGGPVLNLKSSAAAGVPLVVNGKGKVVNLNADRIDGFDSAALRNRTYVWTRKITSGSAATTYQFTLSGLPAGTYDVGYSVYALGNPAANDSATCYLTQMEAGLPLRYAGESRSYSLNSNMPAVSGVAVVNLQGGQVIRFKCDASYAFYTDPTQPIQVFASPTTVVGGNSNLRTTSGGTTQPKG